MQLPYRGSGTVYFNEKEYNCDLYYNDKQGGIILKINVKHEKTLGSFLEVPLEIPCLCGELETGFKFTILNLKRQGTNDLISYGTTVFTFTAEYILCGIGGNINYEQTFHKVNFTLSDIIGWGENSIYTLGENYELISKNEDVCKPIYEGEDFHITYRVYGSMLPVIEQELLKEHIDLKQYGIIEICFDNEEKLKNFNDVFEKLRRLIEIATFRKVNVEKVEAYSRDVVYTIGEQTVERPVDVYGKDIKENKYDEPPKHHWWKWIRLSELIAQNSFEHYFDKHKTLSPIIELFLEPFYVEYSSETRVFLNIVQALETYHSRFITNNIDEFKGRVENIVKGYPHTKGKEIREFLMAKSKGFITLESRISDLLFAENKFNFDTGEIKHKDFPSVIAHTRNYYIHYDESIKEQHRVLSEDELQTYNRSLLQILEYYILLELGFSERVELQKKLTDRWGNVSQNLEILKISRTKHNTQK